MTAEPAPASQEKPAEDWDIVDRQDAATTEGTRRWRIRQAAQLVAKAIVSRQPIDADIQKAAHRQPGNKNNCGEEDFDVQHSRL